MSKHICDEELVKGFLAGDNLCFERIFEKHYQRVYNIAFRIIRNPTDTEDLVQEIFIQVFKKLDSFKFQCQFSTWLYRVASNFSLMKIRSNKRRPMVYFEDLEPSSLESLVEDRSETNDVEYMTCGHEVRGVLTKAVLNLPENYRSLYVLRDIDDLPLKEICDVLNITESVFKNRLHKARMLMKKSVGEYVQETLKEAA